MESIWNRAFNSFGFISLLVCVAVLLTMLTFSVADETGNSSVDLLLLQSQGSLMADIEAAQPGFITQHLPQDLTSDL